MLFAAMALMTVWPFDLAPADPLETDAGRIVAYGVLAATFIFGFPHRLKFAFTWPALLAVADELLPVLLGHHVSVVDAIWKAAGIGGGFALGLAVNRISHASP